MRFIKKINSGEDLFSIYTIAIACCSTAIAFLFFFQNAFFDHVGWIDPFLYIGYGANYLDPSYSGTYKISRLPWVLVQTLFRSIFSQELVGYFLHFSLYVLSAFLVFRISRKFAPAFVCAILALPFPILLFSYSGNPDYHNNFAAALFLYLIFYVISHAKNDKDDKKFFIKTGILYALTIHTSILLALDYAVFAAAFYIGIKLQNQQDPFKKIGKKILWVFGGFLLCTLILCLLNESFGRHFWFMKPLWKFMLGSSTSSNGDYWQPLSSFIANTKHLSLFAAIFFYSLFVTIKILLKKTYKKYAVILAVNIAYIIVICELLATQLLQINNLQVDYFAFNALVPSFLTLALNSSYFFSKKNVEISSRKTALSTLLLAILLIAALLKNHVFSTNNQSQFFIYFAAWLAFFFFAQSTKKIPYSHLATSALFLLLVAANFENKVQFYTSPCPHNKSITQAYLEFDEHVKKYKSNFHNRSFSNIFVWWNREKPELKCFDAYSNYSNSDIAQSLVSGGAASSYPIDNPLENGQSQTIERLWSTDRSVEFKDKFFDHTQENRVVILFSKNHEDVTKMIKKLRENGLKFSLTEQRKIITDAFVLDYFILSEEKKSHVSRQPSL